MRTCCEICSGTLSDERRHRYPQAITCSPTCATKMRRRKERAQKKRRKRNDPIYREKMNAKARLRVARLKERRHKCCIVCGVALPKSTHGAKKYCSSNCCKIKAEERRQLRKPRVEPEVHVPTKEEVEARQENARRAARDYYAANRESILARRHRKGRNNERENEAARQRRAKRTLALNIISQMGYDQ